MKSLSKLRMALFAASLAFSVLGCGSSDPGSGASATGVGEGAKLPKAADSGAAAGAPTASRFPGAGAPLVPGSKVK